MKSEPGYKKITGYIMFAAGILCIGVICSRLWSDDIWFDEVFSLGFIRYGYVDIVKLTAMDVHPPFYYMYLKFITDIGTVIAGEGNTIALAKLASSLPWIGLAILSITVIRNKWGMFVSGLFLLLVTSMPQLSAYYVEIRMYSLALLFVSINAVLAVSIISDGANALKWIVFWLSGILTAYTQYYACIAIIGIYIAMFIYALCNKVYISRSQTVGVLICAVLSVLSYLPWLHIMLSQWKNLQGSYWIQPLTLKSLAGCVKFLTLPATDIAILPYICAGAVSLFSALALIITFCQRDKKVNTVVIVALAPITAVVVSGFILSLMGTPIFIYRYMIPAAGGLWFAVAVCTDKITDICAQGEKSGSLKYLFFFCILIPFALTCAVNVRGFYGDEKWKEIHMPEASAVINDLDEETVVVTNFDHVTALMGYYRPDLSVYLYDAESESLIRRMFDDCGDSIGDDQILNAVTGNRPVYFLGSFNSREDIVEKWGELGIKSELEDSILIERYWINVYRLTK